MAASYLAAVCLKKGAVNHSPNPIFEKENGGFDFSKPPLGYIFIWAWSNYYPPPAFFICRRGGFGICIKFYTNAYFMRLQHNW
jgi:hypothetical protein